MKLPWDKNYLKISFHVIVTVMALFITIMLMARLRIIATSAADALGYVVGILSPLLISLVAAFLFDPLVIFYQNKFGKKRPNKEFQTRKTGTALAYITIFGVLGVVVSMAVKSLGATDITQLSIALTRYIEEFSQLLFSLQENLSQMGVLSGLNNFINTLIVSITRGSKNIVLAFAASISSVGSVTLDLFIGLVIAFYFLMEKDRMLFRLRDSARVFLPVKVSQPIENFFTDVNKVFKGYVTGQVTDALIMAALIIISFKIAGIKYAVIIGLVSGFSNLIPYVGAVVAFVLSVLVGLLSGTPIKALYAAIIVLVLQQVDSLIIVPKVVGKSVKLHPVLIILSLSIFGSLFGIWGMVVAVPVTALLKISFDRCYEKRKAFDKAKK